MARPVILCYFILQQDNDTMDGNRAEYFFQILFCYRLFLQEARPVYGEVGERRKFKI